MGVGGGGGKGRGRRWIMGIVLMGVLMVLDLETRERVMRRSFMVVGMLISRIPGCGICELCFLVCAVDRKSRRGELYVYIYFI